MPIPETSPIRELDVRPMLRAGEEPFQAIMNAVDALASGESLRLIAPFRPVPLFSIMASRGYSTSDRLLGGDAWEIVFAPVAGMQEETGLAVGSSPSAIFWGAPIEELELIEFEPPQLIVRILAALESLQAGDVLFVLLARDPGPLFPELAKRGHEWAGNFDASGAVYRLLVRHGGEQV